MDYPVHDVMRRTPRKSLSRFTVASNVMYDELHKEKLLLGNHFPSQSNNSETKQQRNALLRKRTIHGSLENLNKIGKDKTEWMHRNSSKNQNTARTPPPMKMKTANVAEEVKEPFLALNIPLTPTAQQSPTVETITVPGSVPEKTIKPNIDNVGSGDYCSSNSKPLEDSQHDLSSILSTDDRSESGDDYEIQNRENISSENVSLVDMMKAQRKKSVVYKALYVIVFKALKKRSLQLTETEKKLRERREECAARIILHHLLLNSWKTTKGQATAIACENTQMHKTIDNQSLQLGILRKMQAIEKEKTAVVLRDYNEVKGKYHQAIQENETIKEEYAKVLSEKRSLENHLEILRDENSRLNVDLRIKLDKKEMLLRSMEMDRLQAEKFSVENEQLLKEVARNKNQIADLTAQQCRWQEKAMNCESECYALKQELQTKLETFDKAVKDNEDFNKQKELLISTKNKLENAIAEAQAKLEDSTKQKEKLEKAYNECKEELDDLEDQVQYLQTTLKRYKKENLEIRQKLYNCTLKNVQKRRVWGSALYFLVNPIEAFRKYFNPPAELQNRQPQQVKAAMAASGNNKEMEP